MKEHSTDRCLKLTLQNKWCFPIQLIRRIWLKTRLESLVFLAMEGKNLQKSSESAVNLLNYISSQKHLVDPVGKIFVLLGGTFITSLATFVSFLFIEYGEGIYYLHSIISPLIVKK